MKKQLVLVALLSAGVMNVEAARRAAAVKAQLNNAGLRVQTQLCKIKEKSPTAYALLTSVFANLGKTYEDKAMEYAEDILYGITEGKVNIPKIPSSVNNMLSSAVNALSSVGLSLEPFADQAVKFIDTGFDNFLNLVKNPTCN